MAPTEWKGTEPGEDTATCPEAPGLDMVPLTSIHVLSGDLLVVLHPLAAGAAGKCSFATHSGRQE